MHTRVSCAKLAAYVVAEGTGGQVIAGLTSPVLRFAESYPSIFALSLAVDSHFLIIDPIDFCFYQSRCHPSIEFKQNHHTTYYFIFSQRNTSCSRDMVAGGIRGQVGCVGVECHRREAHRRWASLL